ncbi:MAG TPA: MXAN_2755 family glutamic-type intramembrane protease [Anaeromyxobacteraceae bacterium]|nr:MXAN_2755 family glutamic-type intramembrane protease [Anaeromyxobacteraceae bacterium]
MSLHLACRAPESARRELVTTWALALALLVAAKALALVEPTGYLSGNLAGVAAFLFVLLPERRIHREGERWADFGLPWWGWRSDATWRAWAHGLGFAAATCAVVFPLFFVGFWAYGRLLPSLPSWLAAHLAPYAFPPSPRLRLPPRFPLFVLVQVLVVALPEELFYRGWMQTTWAATRPGRRVRVLGASLGAGFLATQVLFALGHLVVFQAWRLGTFFPGLLFGWLRERTGGLAAPVLFHALSNVFIAILEASFYG